MDEANLERQKRIGVLFADFDDRKLMEMFIHTWKGAVYCGSTCPIRDICGESNGDYHFCEDVVMGYLRGEVK